MAVRTIVALLLLIAVAPGAWAQEETANGALTPDPRSLSADWWNYIEQAEDQLDLRIDALLSFAAEALRMREEQAGAPNEDSRQFLERLRVNLGALPELKNQTGQRAEPVPPSAPEYAVQAYLAIERALRDTRKSAQQLAQVVARGDESTRVAERRVDNLMAAYLALPDIDPSRLRRGLQIMASRSGLAVAREQLRVRRETLGVLEDRTEQLELLLEQASDAVVATPEELAEVEARLTALRAEREATQAELSDRQARALGAQGETPLEQARAAWRDQRVIETAARERKISLETARRGLEQAWFSIALAQPDELEPLLSTAHERLSDLGDLLRLARAELDEWAEQSERELANLRLIDPEELEPPLRQVNQQRLETANQTLRNIAEARSIADDAELVGQLTQRRVSIEQGVVVGGVSAVWSWGQRAWQQTSNWLSASLFKVGDTPLTTFGLLRVGMILFIAVWISRFFRHALDRIGSRGEGTQSAFYTVGRLAHYVIIAAAVVIALSSIGLSFSNLAIVAGALGVGIGFGLQSIVGNFVSGLILLFERSLKVGDYIELESGVGGVVKEINVRSTLVTTNQNLDILVPNSEFVSGRLTNWTLKDASRRMHIPFGVAYGTDKDLVKSAVLEAAQEVSFTVKDNPLKRADVWLVEFGDSSLNFELVVWVKQASVRRPSLVHATYSWAIESALGKAGIEIPFPQRDLHLRSGFAGTGGPAQPPAITPDQGEAGDSPDKRPG